MGSRTKIVVLHMKEIIYTAIFAALAVVLIVLLVIMFRPDEKTDQADTGNRYTPGIYTSALTLNNTNLEVEVSVDESRINSIRFSNLDETVTTMFPLIQPAIEDIAEQIYETQSLDDITLPDDTPYTSQIILDAIREAVEKGVRRQRAERTVPRHDSKERGIRAFPGGVAPRHRAVGAKRDAAATRHQHVAAGLLRAVL